MLAFSPRTALQVAAVIAAAKFSICQESEINIVSELLRRVAEQDLAACHLVLLTTAPRSPLFAVIRRSIDKKFLLLDEVIFSVTQTCRRAQF